MDTHNNTTSPEQPLLRTRDVAVMLGMSREKVWRLWHTGRLPGYRFDRNLRFAMTDVHHFMANHYCASEQGLSAPGAEDMRIQLASEYRRF